MASPSHQSSNAVRYLNPDGLSSNPAFTQAVAVSGAATTIYVGMQTALDGSGALVGKGEIAAQTEQVLKNVQTCLEAAGAGPEHLVLWTICIVQGQQIAPAFAAFQRWWGDRLNPPANTVFFVAGFPHPDFLLGIEAVAVVPHTS